MVSFRSACAEACTLAFDLHCGWPLTLLALRLAAFVLLALRLAAFVLRALGLAAFIILALSLAVFVLLALRLIAFILLALRRPTLISLAPRAAAFLLFAARHRRSESYWFLREWFLNVSHVIFVVLPIASLQPIPSQDRRRLNTWLRDVADVDRQVGVSM